MDKPHLEAISQNESIVLRLLRARKYSRIEIQTRDGEMTCIYAEEELSPTGAKVDDIIQSTAFQTLTITQHDGSLKRIKRTIPIKLGA